MKKILAALFIGCLTAVMFMRTCNQGVICLDDYDYVVSNTEIIGGVHSLSPVKMFAKTEYGIFMPLTWISYLVDCEIARHSLDENPSLEERESSTFRVMHIHSALLHGVNAMLVFAFLWMISVRLNLQNVFLVAASTLIWSLHPLRVESVGWLASRKDLVSFFWIALALISWIRQSRYFDKFYWLACGCCLVGALGKPSVMIFPCLVFIIDLLVFRRINLRKNGCWNQDVVVHYLLPFAIGFAIAIEAIVFQNLGGAMAYPVPLWARALNAVVSYGVYLRNIFFPTRLALQCVLQYPYLPHFAIPGLILFAIMSWYLWNKLRILLKSDLVVKEANLLLVGLIWFSASLIPFAGVVGFGYHAYADRFTYIPALGLSLFLLSFGKIKLPKPIVLSVLCLWIAGLAALSYRQIGFWDDQEKLWYRTLSIDGPGNLVANICLGMYDYDVKHDVKASVAHFDTAFAVEPNTTFSFGTIYLNALSEAGEDDKALSFYRLYQTWNDKRMKEIEPDAPEGSRIWGEDFAAGRIAMLLTDTNLISVAEAELDDLLKVHPDSQNAHYLKGRIAEMKGDHSSALAAWRKTVDLTRPAKTFTRYRFLRKIVEPQ